MKIVFSLFGRPKELKYCFQSLLSAKRFNEFEVYIDINDYQNSINDDVCRQAEKFVSECGVPCELNKLNDGFGANINMYRTLNKFSEKVLYMASDVLIHYECLDKYLTLNERFPDYPITLYHPLPHPLYYKDDFAVMRSTTVESLMLNPSLYFDYCLFRNKFALSKASTIDWMLNWVFKLRKVPVITDHFSYVQHLGLSGGTTSSLWPPTYCYDYIDQPAFFRILKELGYDLNLCSMVRNRDPFEDFMPHHK